MTVPDSNLIWKRNIMLHNSKSKQILMKYFLEPNLNSIPNTFIFLYHRKALKGFNCLITFKMMFSNDHMISKLNLIQITFSQMQLLN